MKNSAEIARDEPTTSVAQTGTLAGSTPGGNAPDENMGARRVTGRAFLIGLLLTGFLAWFHCYMSAKYNVHMIGGIQMPFGALALLMIFVLGNLGLKKLAASNSQIAFSPAELLTIYAMMVFGALVSTPGCDNMFLVAGPALFYFSSPENGWEQLFYKYVPEWFAPGWNGTTYRKEVIDPVYLGQVPFNEIPWHAWAMMLMAWGIFLGLVYGLMFFTALLFRKQWTQREALAFPLVEVPVQMTQAQGSTPGAPSLWSNRVTWIGVGLAFFWHSFFGMNFIFPEWPIAPVNVKDGYPIIFPEAPMNAIPLFKAEIYLGMIGLAYLLTREVSFSCWFFFLATMLSYSVAASLGQSNLLLAKSGVASRPDFIIYQSVGAWGMMAVILMWTARESLGRLVRAAFTSNQSEADEPFSPRFMVFGFLFCFAGLIAWSVFAGINIAIALTFFAIFLLTSLVLTRLVIEGGFLFPQPPFLAMQFMSTSVFGSTLGAADMTKLSFLQPMILLDMRTNVLPAFLNTMKFAEVLGLDRKHLRRLLISVVAALALTVVVMIATTLQVLYSQGGLSGYEWFSRLAAPDTFASTAGSIKNPSGITFSNWGWIALGATFVWLMVAGRSRLLWFPFHPLGYLLAPGYPITRLWFSFFLGWLIKTMVMKYGGSDTYVSVRPFMIGLILGNAISMVFWTLLVFKLNGTPIPYWPA